MVIAAEALSAIKNWDAPTWAAVVSSLLAFISLAVSFRSYTLSKKALNITEDQEQRRQPALALYIKAKYVRSVASDDPCRVYAFSLLISNNSETDNSLANLDLYVTFTTP